MHKEKIEEMQMAHPARGHLRRRKRAGKTRTREDSGTRGHVAPFGREAAVRPLVRPAALRRRRANHLR